MFLINYKCALFKNYYKLLIEYQFIIKRKKTQKDVNHFFK